MNCAQNFGEVHEKKLDREIKFQSAVQPDFIERHRADISDWLESTNLGTIAGTHLHSLVQNS